MLSTMIENPIKTQSDYYRKQELESFDDTKADVKGLVDEGVTKIPQIFIHPPSSVDLTGSSISGSDSKITRLQRFISVPGYRGTGLQQKYISG
ncbi:hypothetical protein IFM89_016854 [Coptis chinensis]|uniref:Uncharacterized protein n=1 Tax=Coptis chinensis TaxID=261450 RepID=A0A835GXW0_9MAGN|nr:hypothetical protein IFM89_016854 [Coptis chinensis]